MTLKNINQELTQELAQLRVTSEQSIPDPDIKYLRERMYSLHRNTNKKLVVGIKLFQSRQSSLISRKWSWKHYK